MTSHPRRRAKLFARRLTPPIAAVAMLATAGASAVEASQRTPSSARASSGVPRALSAAAARSRQSDRMLVSDANALAGCVRRHSTRARRCKPMHATVQRAGVRLARADHRLADVARSGAGAHSAAVGLVRHPPQLTVTGQTLTWTPNPHIDTFVVEASVPGQSTQFSVVHGTSFTPPPVPGATVSYSVRTAALTSPWSAWEAISYPSAESPGNTSRGNEARRAAPILAVSAQTLTWNRVDGVNVYVLESKSPGRPETYSVVVGDSTTPAPQPGATVHYTVRTAFDGSAWAPEVTIAYSPAAEPGSGSREEIHKEEPPVEKTHEQPPVEKAHEQPPVEKTHERPPVEKAHEQPPVEEPREETPAGDPSFQPGINDGPNVNGGDLQAAVLLGAKTVRVGFSTGASVAELEPVIGAYAAKGIRVAPVAEFWESMPTPAQARNLASWASAFGPGGTFWSGRSDGQAAIRSIEFGNETASGAQYGVQKGQPGYTALAQNYATRLREAGEAIEASGIHVGLLAQEDDETGDWINGMYSAVPNLTRYVAGWVIHPYGGEAYVRERLQLLIGQTAAHGGGAIPIDATEWGVATDNGRCLSYNEGLNRCMTYEEAAQMLNTTFSWMSKMLGSRLGDFFVYQTGDQDITGQSTNWQGYFGVLQHNLAPKGAYTTAVEALLAS